MQLFKALQPIQVLSFDLDDTLYDNKPVIAAAEQAMLQTLALHAPQSQGLNSEFWWQQRKLLAKTNPDIRHDIGRWRLLGLEAGLLSLGLAQSKASNIAQLAYAAFLTERTRIMLKPDIIRLLSTLAKHYRLIAITNGNASIHKMGVSELFEFSLQAGPDGRMKPYADLFLAAADRLQVEPSAILHIGDSHRADVLGALNAGCQAAWLDHHKSAVSILPHIRLTDVQQLQLLLSH
ncbi:HAD-IA family hydrolase [Rheinheimera sp. FR7-31]|uniref:HAD-IA family hydrolase n=1 Tax=Rheinheimera fenheensis TaxID=3152295 RepID=UPI00325E0C03